MKIEQNAIDKFVDGRLLPLGDGLHYMKINNGTNGILVLDISNGQMYAYKNMEDVDRMFEISQRLLELEI